MSNSSRGECQRQNYTNVVIRGACVQLLRGIGTGQNDFFTAKKFKWGSSEKGLVPVKAHVPRAASKGRAEFLSWMFFAGAGNPSTETELLLCFSKWWQVLCVTCTPAAQSRCFQWIKNKHFRPRLKTTVPCVIHLKEREDIKPDFPYFPPTPHFWSSQSSICIPQAVMPILGKWLNSMNLLSALDWVTASDITLFLLHSCLA